MQKFLYALAALIVLLAAILLLAPQLVPASSYKGRIESQASTALGREVTLGDDISFQLLPRAAFNVSELTVANAAGFEGAHLARVERAEIGVNLMKFLFGGEVAIDKFVLTEPDIRLAKKADGAVNWTLGSTAPVDEDAEESAGASSRDLQLGDVRIVDGALTFEDAAAGKTYELGAMNVGVELQSLKEPLQIKGDLTFQGAPTSLNLIVTTLKKIADKEPANMKLDATLGDASLGADLTLTPGAAMTYAGPVSLDAPNLPALAALFDVALQDAPGFDKLSASGQATGGPDRIDLKEADIVFDAINASGEIGLGWSGARPKATGSLAADALDLRPYMPPPVEAPDSFPAWSEETIDFASLRNMDADLNIRTEKIFLNDLEAGASQLRLTIDNGRMTAEIPQLSLYGGGGSGQLVVNARGATPSFSGVFDTTSVKAEPFAMDVLKNDRLLGIGGLKFNFTASGSSQAAIMSSLDGEGGFDLNDGAIKGVNLAKIAGAVASLAEGGVTNAGAISAAVAEARRPNEQTDFSKFLSAFVIESGVMQAREISLTGPFVTMAGGGSVNLAAQTIDLRLAPRATTTADGEGGRAVAVPVRIGGTFAEPTIGVDVETLVRGEAEELIRGVVGDVLGDEAASDNPEGVARELLRGVLGGEQTETNNSNASGEEEQAEEEDGAASAVRSLFGIGRKKKTEDPDG